MFREPLELDEYLNARRIVDPIGLFDCVLPCSGAEAVLVVDREQNSWITRPMIELRSGYELHNFRPGDVAPVTYGWTAFQKRLFADAGLEHDDIDCVQLYDDYPIMVGIQLEDLGFCDKGAAGSYLEGLDISPSGNLPLNTGGGQLSVGQSGAGGGMIGLVEAVQQLQWEADGRQVPNARTALVSGFGMVSYGRGLSTGALILERGS
ncbi:MAG: thiolase family protein [Actinomycetota bacterium]